MEVCLLTKRIVYISLVLIWLIIIFSLSSEVGKKSDIKSKTIVNLIYEKSDIIEIDNITKKELNYYVRKLGHVLEYFILTIFILGLLKALNIDIKYKYGLAYFISTTCAILDEYNQTFVIGRDGRITDIFIDNLGIVSALVIVSIFHLLQRTIKWKTKGGEL
ncbi:MAG: hypothetical protein FH751_15660 [Firmicutes bacterium]|nr:hypothetical protein [Bacillota bacterium]